MLKGKSIIKPLLIILISLAAATSCEKEDRLYQAEKELFKARKMRHDLASTTIEGDFLSRTIQTYGGIVDRHRDHMGESAVLDTIIVAAKMEMAQLEFQTGMLEEALRDFKEAVELTGEIPSARANAIYSSAVISGQMQNPESALEYYRRFYREFLSKDARPFRIELNSRYILTPVRIGHLLLQLDDRAEAERWYEIAEKFYSYIIENGKITRLVEEAKLNRITALLQREEWSKAGQYLERMKKGIIDRERLPALMYIEAQIELNGYNNRSGALRILENIESEHPESAEASSALVTAAGIRFREKNYDEVRNICSRIIKNYGGRKNEAAEAAWMLARAEEESGNWLEASLHYKSLYTSHPYTLQGLEAPLRIAAHFAESGESAVARDRYGKARDHYLALAREAGTRGARIMAEKYLVRAMTEEGKWEEAVERLLELVEEYPGYINFRNNYLRAASICEKKLKDTDRAEEILTICIERYPETSLASEAEKQLARIRSGK